MVLVTVSDVEDEALIRGIDISKYSKGKLERMIDGVQSMMQEMTGRIFDKQVKNFMKMNYHSDVIALPYSPIIITDSEENPDTFVLKIDGATIDEDDYTVDKPRGLIYLDDVYPYHTGTNIDGSFKVEVDYTCGYNPAYPVAVELALDILMYQIKGKEIDASIDTVKEGDISIKYAKTGALPSDLNSRLLALQRPLMEIIYD
jgi:hypothetical protein